MLKTQLCILATVNFRCIFPFVKARYYVFRTEENWEELHDCSGTKYKEWKCVAFLITWVKWSKVKKSRREHQRTQNQESQGYSVQSTSYNCQQSNSKLSFGRERRKGNVEKGLWADTCSAIYGFAPESEMYFKKSSHRWKLLVSILEHNQQRLLRFGNSSSSLS